MKTLILDALLQFLPISFYVTDSKGRFLLVSNQKAENWGTVPPKMIGRTDFDYMLQEEAVRSQKDNEEVIRTRIPKRSYEWITRKNGTKTYVLAIKAPIEYMDGSWGVLGISIDFTKEKEYESSLLMLLGIATHDIRSPLISLDANMRLLLKGVFGNMDDSVKETLRESYQRLLRIIGVVSDYLCKSSILGGETQLPLKEEVDLREDIIDPVLAEFAYEFEKNRITIDNRLGSIPAGKVIFRGNREWMRSVYRNLISNALKYGGEGCTIALGYEDHGEWYIFNVYNSGPPIPKGMEEEIFHPMVRCEESSSNISGSGFGLSAAKKIIEDHGGKIWVRNTDDGHPDFRILIMKD